MAMGHVLDIKKYKIRYLVDAIKDENYTGPRGLWEYSKAIEQMGISMQKLAVKAAKANESIKEGKYHEYRNDDTMSPKQKIGQSMREVRDGLNHLEKLVKMNVRLKNELSVNSDSYWKNTHKALHKISERLVKLANKVGQLQ